MSRKPPLPGNAVSPFPLRATEAAERADARHELAEKTVREADESPDARGSSGNVGLRVAAGTAIGSAAIAAALLFWNRSKTN